MSKDILDLCCRKWEMTKIVGEVMVPLFGLSTLLNSTVRGQQSERQSLDEEKTKALIRKLLNYSIFIVNSFFFSVFILRNFPQTTEAMVVARMTTKLRDLRITDKRQRAKRQRREEQEE